MDEIRSTPTTQLKVVMCTPADVIPPANLQEFELYLKAVMDERKLNISSEDPSNSAAAILTEFLREYAPQESVCFVTEMELLDPNFTFSLFSRLFTNGIGFSILRVTF